MMRTRGHFPIHRRIFREGGVWRELTPTERSVLVWIWGQVLPLGDDRGTLETSAREIADENTIHAKTVPAVLRRLVGLGLIEVKSKRGSGTTITIPDFDRWRGKSPRNGVSDSKAKGVSHSKVEGKKESQTPNGPDRNGVSDSNKWSLTLQNMESQTPINGVSDSIPFYKEVDTADTANTGDNYGDAVAADSPQASLSLKAEKAKPAKRRKSKANPDHQRFVDLWHELATRYNREAPHWSPKAHGIVKRLLRAHGFERCAERARFLVDSPPRWMSGGVDLGFLEANWDKLAPGAASRSEGSASGGGLSAADLLAASRSMAEAGH